MRRSLLIIPLLLAMAVLASTAPTAARSRIAIGIANPEGMGADVSKVIATLDKHVEDVDTKPGLWALYSMWGARGGRSTCEPGFGTCAFPVDAVMELHERDITPVIWWIPTDPKNPQLGRYERYKRIVKGKHDAYIRTWARKARDIGRLTGKHVIIRFAHESNGRAFWWGIPYFDNTHANFKAAWRRIWNIFRRNRALPYVRFLWSQYSPVARAYPGDAYVDYVGYTMINWGEGSWTSPRTLLRTMLARSLTFTKKPIIVAEMATHYEGGYKAAWLRKAYRSAYTMSRKFKGIMYLDTDEPHRQYGQPDWRLIKPDDGSALRAYQGIATDSRFQGSIK